MSDKQKNKGLLSFSIHEHRLDYQEILDVLYSHQMIDKKDYDTGLFIARRKTHHKEHPLTSLGSRRMSRASPPHDVLTEDILTEWLAKQVNIPYMHIDPLKIDVAAVCPVVSHAYAETYRILPVAVQPGKVVIATAEPFDKQWVAAVEQAQRVSVERVMASPTDIVRYLAEFYSLARSIKQAVDLHADMPSGIGNFEQLVQLGSQQSLDANDQAIVRIVDWLLQYAFEQRASDIHIEPRRLMGTVRFRIDGVLHSVYQAPAAVMAAMTSRIKLMGRMDVVEKRRPQDGRIKTQIHGQQEIELRLSTMPTAFGEKLVLRIFDPQVLLRSFTELGFGQEDEKNWRSLFTRPHGIILVTGPTGSGKTTTLYSTLRELATPEKNVCTIEDPIEMVYSYLNQVQVQHDLGFDFAEGVKTLLRQDPDIIMVGEIRDLQTAEMAVQAALTGHLVLSTLHTNDAPSAIVRLLDLGVPPYLIRSTLLGILAQRLTRTLCPNCKRPVDIEESAWKDLVRPWSSKLPSHAHEPVGCIECRMTGYMGRMGLYEMLIMTPGVRQYIDHQLDIARLREQAIKDGMRPLRLCGAKQIANGLTTPEEVVRNTPPAAEQFG